MPRGDNMCDIEGDSDISVPTKTNLLGVKGVGEAGTVGALPAVMNAVIDALAARHPRVRHARDERADLARNRRSARVEVCCVLRLRAASFAQSRFCLAGQKARRDFREIAVRASLRAFLLSPMARKVPVNRAISARPCRPREM